MEIFIYISTLSHSEFGSLLFTLIILTFSLYVYIILLYKVEKDVFFVSII